MAATEQNNGNGTTARHNGMAKRQRQNGNRMVETSHNLKLSPVI